MSTIHAFPDLEKNSSSACPGTCQPSDRTVCHCHGVLESVLRVIIDRHEVASVDQLADHTPAGSGCSACKCRLQRLVSGLPAVCGGRFDQCGNCGCINAICQCEAAG